MDLKTLHAQYKAECEKTPPWVDQRTVSFPGWLAARLEEAGDKLDRLSIKAAGDLLDIHEEIRSDELRKTAEGCIEIAEDECFSGSDSDWSTCARLIADAIRAKFLTSPKRIRPSTPLPTSTTD